MGLTPDAYDELVALDVLGALDADDRAMLDESHQRDRRAMLERAVTALEQAHTVAPPSDLRSHVVQAARARRPRTVDPAPIHELFARQVEALAALLGTLAEADWQRRAAPYRWSVHGLVAHLLVIERYSAARLGLLEDGPADAAHLAMGAEDIAAELAGSPLHTATRWVERARATADALRRAAAGTATLPRTLELHGAAFGLDGGIIARAFEVWTHTDDIRRATGRALVAPAPADLRAMSSFSVQALPFTLSLTDPERTLTPTRVVLTGAGGGTFDLVRSDTAFSTLIVADVIDYCRVVARRIAPDELDATVEGDGALARSLLASAGIFAV